MGHTRPLRSFRSLAFAMGAVGVLASTALAGPGFQQWTQDLWSGAQGADPTVVDRLTGGAQTPDVRGTTLANDLSGYATAARDRDRVRLERLDELRGELVTAQNDSDHEEALRLALEMQDLEGDPRGFALRPEIAAVVRGAERAARELEHKREWLPAFRLFAMLHVLHEVDRRFEDDWLRLVQRRTMIGFYAPEVLYQMVSDERVADGEDPLPAFNETGPTWRERVRDLNSEMIVAALWRASDRHIDDVPIKDMLLGGFDALTVMATTPELASAMPELRNEAQLNGFVERLKANRLAIEGLDGTLRYQHIERAMGILERINDETVGLPIEALLHEFGNGAASTLDEYSQFYWPESIERASRTTEGNFKGVGIQITQNDALELEVVTPVAGTPAFRAGIRPGDVIAEIEGQPAIGLDTNSAVERITGPAGSYVTLGIKREGHDDLLDFRLEREVITLYAARGWQRNGPGENDWDWFVDDEAGIGYIRVSQFLNGATQQMAGAIAQMQREGLNAIILDLRYNSGGLLNEAVDMTNLFLDGGVVVTQEDADGVVQDTQRARRGRAMIGDMPVVVLVNGGSASASEIVAGALQDHGKAVLLGTRTYGKGSVQRIFPLDRAQRAAFKLTTQYYKLPSGRLIHRQAGSPEWGIAPNVEVRMTPDEISTALLLRREADVVNVDERGNTVAKTKDPEPLVTEGLDAQLQTAVLLLRAKVMGDREAQAAGLH